MGKITIALWIVVIAAGLAVVGARVFRPAAPRPGVFASDVRLDEAIERGRTEGRPVLAVVTADWCPPCQALKRGALADERVAAFISGNAIPVYVDADANAQEAAALGVSSIPASVVIRDGVIVARTGGAAGAGDYLAWLRGALGPEALAGPVTPGD